ncbi:MAG: hypothetical protein QXI58_04665 [Candidatus Micrarchaeia archaeon]
MKNVNQNQKIKVKVRKVRKIGSEILVSIDKITYLKLGSPLYFKMEEKEGKIILTPVL